MYLGANFYKAITVPERKEKKVLSLLLLLLVKRENNEVYLNWINYTLFDSTKQNYTVVNTTRHSTAAQAYNLGHSVTCTIRSDNK